MKAPNRPAVQRSMKKCETNETIVEKKEALSVKRRQSQHPKTLHVLNIQNY
jgi:hypothetical protein